MTTTTLPSDGMVSTSEQLSKLVFCSAVFKEALRLKSVAPFLMYYCKVKSLCFMPSGTIIQLLLRGMIFTLCFIPVRYYM